MLLPNISVNGYKESTCPMLIAPLGQHDVILGKLWMNRHGVVLDILKDTVLFVPGRCDHDGNQTSAPKDLILAKPPSPVQSILKRKSPPQPTCESEPESLQSDVEDDLSTNQNVLEPKLQKVQKAKDIDPHDYPPPPIARSTRKKRNTPSPRAFKECTGAEPNTVDIC